MTTYPPVHQPTHPLFRHPGDGRDGARGENCGADTAWNITSNSHAFTSWRVFIGVHCIRVSRQAFIFAFAATGTKTFEGYTKEHNIKSLVWYAHFQSMEAAIKREKLLKKWHRDWKFRLIERHNPDWLDLHDHIDTNVEWEG